MIYVFIVILVLFLLAMLWLGVDVRYWDDKLTLWLRVLCFKFKILPKSKKKKKKPKKKKKKDKNKEDSENKLKKKHKKAKPDIKGLIDLGLTAAGRLKRKIRVSRLTLHYTAGSEDPCDTALQFGRVSAAVGILLPRICESFNVNRHDVRVDSNFDLPKPKVEFDTSVGMFLWQLVFIGVAALIGFLKLQVKNK